MAPRRHVRLNAPSMGEAEARAVASVVRSGMVTQGARVRKFEGAMLDYLNSCTDNSSRDFVREALMVNSGSSANLLAADYLRAHAEGRERVVTPALTWSTTVAPLIQRRLHPVFVDVGPDLTMDVAAAKVALEDDGHAEGPPLALLPVHLLGHACDMTSLELAAEAAGAYLFEDACEALGTTWAGRAVGTFGDFGSFSFYFSHHLSTVEGGLLVTRQGEYALRSAREHGWIRDYPLGDKVSLRAEYPELDDRWIFDRAGYNLRSTELNAAIGLLQLRHQGAWQRRRIAIADWYAEHLAFEGLVHPYRSVPSEARPNPFSYPLLVTRDAPFTKRDLVEWLERRGVETRPIMTGNITRHPWLRKAGYPAVDLPMTDWAHTNGFLLPCHPHLTRSDLEYVKASIAAFLRSRGALKEAN